MALETILKFSASLENLAKWRRDAPRLHQARLAKVSDPRERQRLNKNYKDTIEGLFGSQEVLDMLSDSGEASVRAKLAKAELAAALLASSFARKSASGTIGCYNQLVKDLDNHGSVEKKVGTCSPEDSRRWKKAMFQVATLYKSPLFAEFAKAE